MPNKITLSVIKADIGGFVGHSSMHPDLLKMAAELMATAKRDGPVIDFHVTHCGDDLGLIMTHHQGNDSAEIHGLAWDVFERCTQVAKDLKRLHSLDWGLQLGKVDQAVRTRAVEVYGDRVNIAGIVDPHLEALADTIVSKARSLWGPGADLKAVVLTGGGSLELAPYVRRAYPHTRTVGGDPQFANVTGYLRAGLRRFNG